MHFLQRSTYFSKTCCRPLITSKFLTSELPFHDWKSPEIAWSEIWIEFCVRYGKVDRWNPIRTSAIQSRSFPMRFLGFSNHEEGAPRQEISKWSTVCSTFSGSGWSVVRSALLAKGVRHRTSTKFRLGVGYYSWGHSLSEISMNMGPFLKDYGGMSVL
jgi:hypothetical protein